MKAHAPISKREKGKRIAGIFGILVLILFVWSELTITYAKIVIAREIKPINFAGSLLSQKAINDGCVHISGPLDYFEPLSTIIDILFGISTQCAVDTEKVFIHSGNFNDYKKDVLAADKWLRTHGWKRDDLSGSDVDWKLQQQYVWPIQQPYFNSRNNDELTLFTFNKADPLNSTLLFDENNLTKYIHSDNEYIYGIVVTREYPTWPSRILPTSWITILHNLL